MAREGRMIRLLILMKNKNTKDVTSSSRKVLVTGASGFIGSHLSGVLLKRGYEVVGLYLDQEQRIEQLKKQRGFHAIEVDITDRKELEKVFSIHNLKGVFHTAAKLPDGKQEDPILFFDVNVKGTINILDVCLKYGVKDIVYSSSMSVYGTNRQSLPVNEQHPVAPYDFYSLSKFQGEEVCGLYAQYHNLNIVILRYAGVYGEGRRDGVVFTFLKQALENKTLKIYENTSWDIVYVRDVIEANILVLEKADVLSGEVINIGSGVEVSVQDLAKNIIELTNSKSQIQSQGSSSPSRRFFYDIRKAKKMLNFTPHSPYEGLQEYLKEIKQRI